MVKLTTVIGILVLVVFGTHSEGVNSKQQCGQINVALRKVTSVKTDVVAEVYVGEATPRSTYCLDLKLNGRSIATVQFKYFGRATDGREIWGDFTIVSHIGEPPIELYYADNDHHRFPLQLRPVKVTDMLIGATKVGACVLGERVVFHPCWHEERIVVYHIDPIGNDKAYKDFNEWASRTCTTE